MRRLIYVLIVLSAGTLSLPAQTPGTMSTDIRRTDFTPWRAVLLDSSDWLKTSNASGLGVGPLPDCGTTQAGANCCTGEYRRSQESRSVTSCGFSSEAFRSLEKIHLYGRFAFTQSSHKGHAWCDNFDPYRGNPYLVGSRIDGNYQEQIFDFSVKAASVCLWDRCWAGIRFDYQVGDFSRSNDVRSRAQKADYSLSPGISVRLGASDVVGLSFDWRHYKEKMNKLVAKSEAIDHFQYIDFRGLSEYVIQNPLAFTRRYIGNTFSAELQYFHGSSLNVFAGAGMEKENVTGESMESPGDYSAVRARFGLNARIPADRGSVRLNIMGNLRSGSAREYLQERIIETNSAGMVDSYWKLMMANLRYEDIAAGLDIHCRRYVTGTPMSFDWYAGAGVRSAYEYSRYILPESVMSWFRVEPYAEYGRPLVSSARFTMSGRCSGGYVFCPAGELSLATSGGKTNGTAAADNVVIPDSEFYRTGAAAYGCVLDFNFVFKSGRSCFFSVYTRGYSTFSDKGSRILAGVAMGI